MVISVTREIMGYMRQFERGSITIFGKFCAWQNLMPINSNQICFISYQERRNLPHPRQAQFRGSIFVCYASFKCFQSGGLGQTGESREKSYSPPNTVNGVVIHHPPRHRIGLSINCVRTELAVRLAPAANCRAQGMP